MSLSKEMSKIFSYESWVHAVSGATGSVIAMSVFYPLDTVRARLQIGDSSTNRITGSGTFSILNEIFLKEGISSLYRGLIPVLQSICISNFVYFYTFHSLKAMNGKNSQNALKDLLLGSIAGIVNVLSTTPFWVVNSRLKIKGINGPNDVSSRPFTNLLNGMTYIGRTEGVKGLWAGAIPSLILVINPALQFMLYEAIKRKLTKSYGDLNGAVFFGIGALSKAFATILTYPLQLIQTKLRTGDKSLPRGCGTLEAIYIIAKQYGFKGLYRGMEAKIWQTVLTAALMFTAYEKIALMVGRILLNRGVSRMAG